MMNKLDFFPTALDAEAPPQARPMDQRHFLFLQGLSTPLFYRLGKRLQLAGSVVSRINICAGDHLFWPARATAFRDAFEHWPQFIEDFIRSRGITDIILFGDCRPYHLIAIEKSAKAGIAVHAFEEGVLRPHWITMVSETAGQSVQLAVHQEAPTSPPVRLAGGFAQRALWDIAFHACNTVAPFLYPHYVRHRPSHPLVEGFGWLQRSLKKASSRKLAASTLQRLAANQSNYFLLPLQLDSDAQIRFRSPFADMAEVMNFVMASFAASAPKGARLLVKAHPLDNGVVDRHSQVDEIAGKHGLSGRVDFIDGGHLPTIIDGCTGVVLVNSTLGLTALHQKRAVYALAQPSYKAAGLTSAGDLSDFWVDPQLPDPKRVAAYERQLMLTTQINGSYFNLAGINLAVDGIVERLASYATTGSRL